MSYRGGGRGTPKIYEVLLKESEAKKLTAKIVKPELTNLLRELAEKEFETKFSRLLSFVTKPIHIKKGMLKNPIIQKLMKKYPGKIVPVTNDKLGENASVNAEEDLQLE